jgi:hypothetical protein
VKFTDVSEVCATSIIRAMMEAVHISETSVNFNVITLRYIPEDSTLHTRRRENLKSHITSQLTIKLTTKLIKHQHLPAV